ncbi:MAG: hypothetical protein ACI8X5_000776 [Planctomycetota bacterium]|jgi:hypothetical protein
MTAITRIALWSGPRNISTALMRSFGSRDDSIVVDEPFYAFYLKATGLEHPVNEEILASQPNAWQDVAAAMTGDVPEGVSVFYQKQMAHHLLPEIGREWMSGLKHAFLIREPRAMLASYMQKREEARLEDLGFTQQVGLYDWLKLEGSQPPPVIDSRQVLENPRAALLALCEALGIEFQESMLTWEPGLHGTDGVWADHWYDAVRQSTGFGPYKAKDIQLTPELEAIAKEAEGYYDYLYSRRLPV